MARPNSITLSKTEQKQIVSLFKETQDARKIANSLYVPRYQVMAFLEQKGLRSYSEGSYV
jgi:hypothetical protein